MEITEGALAAAIDKMRVGNRTGDISAAIQNYVESRGLHVTRANTPVMVWDGRCTKARRFPIMERREPECLFVRE